MWDWTATRWIFRTCIFLTTLNASLFASQDAWLSDVTIVHFNGKLSRLTTQGQIATSSSESTFTYRLEGSSNPNARAILTFEVLSNQRTDFTLQLEHETAKRVLLKIKPSFDELSQPAIPFLLTEETLTIIDDPSKSQRAFDVAGVTTKLAVLALRPVDSQAFLTHTSEPSSAPEIEVELTSSKDGSLFTLEVYSGPKDSALFSKFDPRLNALFYSSLWEWLRVACFGVASLMNNIYFFLSNWPLTIALLALLVRVLIYPAAAYGLKVQERHCKNMAQIKPQLDEAKSALKGRELHEKTMKIMEENGVSPLDGLKGLLPLFLQIPFFIIMYSVIGEEFRLGQASFLWASNLTLPDRLLTSTLSLPLLGNSLNLFPVFMGIVTIVSSRLQSDDPSERKTLYAMAALFTLLFYNFPAGLVMYWTLSNLFQMLHQLARKRILA